MYKIIVYFIVFFSFGVFFSKAFSEKTIVINTPIYNFAANDYIGKFDYLKFSLGESYWIKSIEYKIVGAQNSSLHHAVLQDQSRMDYTCNGKIGERIHGAGKELTPLIFPEGFAYPINSNDKLTLLTHIINPQGIANSDVRFQAILKVKPKLFFNIQFRPVQPIWLDIVNCSLDPTFFIEPRTSMEFKIPQKIKVPYDSKIIFMGGHFHEFGKELSISINNNKYTFYPKPTSENIESIDVKIFNKDYPVLKNEQELDMSVIYENTSIKIIDGMGIGMVYISK